MLNYLSFRYEFYKLDKISKVMNLEYESIEKRTSLLMFHLFLFFPILIRNWVKQELF